MLSDAEIEVLRAEQGDQLTFGYGKNKSQGINRRIISSSPESFRNSLLFFVALGTFTQEEAEVYLGEPIYPKPS